MKDAPPSEELLGRTTTSTGQSLTALTEESPVLLVLLRHEGCTFCRNAMSDIARSRSQIEGAGARIVLAHMGTDEEFVSFSRRYGLSSLAFVSDPERTLYRGLGLRRGRLWQLLGPRVLWAWIKSTLGGHLPGRLKGDPFQLPGAFLLHRGQVVRAHVYRDVSDRPDYVSLATL